MPSATLVFPWPVNLAHGALWPLQLCGDKQPAMAVTSGYRGGMVWPHGDHMVTTFEPLNQASSKSSCSFWLTSRCTLSIKLAWNSTDGPSTHLHPIAAIQPMQPCCLFLPIAAYCCLLLPCLILFKSGFGNAKLLLELALGLNVLQEVYVLLEAKTTVLMRLWPLFLRTIKFT